MNPFCSVDGACYSPNFPVIPSQQDCFYRQYESEISGLLVVRRDGQQPTDWLVPAGWSGVIDNSDPTKGRYLVGSGRVAQAQENQTTLANGRFVRVSERFYELTFEVTNFDPGHLALHKRLESGDRFMNMWLETVEGRLIGGPCGLQPFIVNSTLNFDNGAGAVETMLIKVGFFFTHFPAMSLAGLVTDNNGNVVSSTWGQVGAFVWGDPATGEIWGDPATGEMWGWN